MIISKFSIGEQIRHKLLGYLGVIIDIDSEYSLNIVENNKILVDIGLEKNIPWYHILMEDSTGNPIHTYVSESDIINELFLIHPEQPMLDVLSYSIQLYLKKIYFKN